MLKPLFGVVCSLLNCIVTKQGNMAYMGHPHPSKVDKCDPVSTHGDVKLLKSKERPKRGRETRERILHFWGDHVWRNISRARKDSRYTDCQKRTNVLLCSVNR